MLLSDLIARATEAHPNRIALSHGSQHLTYAELWARTSGVAAALRAKGIGPGARVALVLDTSLSAVVWFWGVLESGAEVVDIPGHAVASVVAEVLGECRPAAVALDAGQFAKLEEVAHALPKIVLASADCEELAGRLGLELVLAPQASELGPRVRPARSASDVALTIYTSGTTGRPKGVMLSHQNLLSNVEAALSRMPLSEQDSLLLVVPLFFVHGRMQLITHAYVAARICFSEGFRFPQVVLRELEGYEVTGMSGVPFHFTTLVERTHLANAKLPKLRYLLITGGAMSRRGKRRLESALPQVGIHTAYGSTEASPRITYASPEELKLRPETAGRALPSVVVEILGSDGVVVPQGGIGEVAVRGPNVMKGYVSGDERAVGSIDAQGRLHTGDLGYLDSDGYLFLVGRRSEMIKSAGERVFPLEIEEVLNKHPDLLESAVLGVPDRVLGERLVALVVLKPGAVLDPVSVRTHCLRWLPFVRVPRDLAAVEALPKTASTKIARQALPQRWAAAHPAPGIDEPPPRG